MNRRLSLPDQIAKGTIVLGEDFSQHRIQGYVPHAEHRGWDARLDVPLISHVEGNLWQGGCMDGVRLPDGFKHVVSLYDWEQYELPEGCDRIEVRMYDSLDQSTDQVEELAQKVVEYCEDGPTLVHCQAGVNRSGLVAARALIYMGHTPVEAISLLRSSRTHMVLCNETFENWIAGCA
jgi:protein-tyrosine phosphatase